MNIVLSEMRFKILLVESQGDEKFRKGKSFSFKIKDDWFGRVGLFFSNWNTLTSSLYILKYIKIVVSATLFGLLYFGF